MPKMAIFGPKPWLTPFEKCQFFDFLNIASFYSLERRFSVVEFRKGYVPGLYWLKKKLENGHFWKKTMR